MEKYAVKYFQIKVRIDEELVFNRFKKFLKSANLSYSCTYNPIGQFWDVFIGAEGEDMLKFVYSAINEFVETERCIRGDELYERIW